jgi:hypothetical protein
MNEIKTLEMLNQYYNLQRNVICFMIWAMQDFQRNKEQSSWEYLFDWCLVQDEREALWKELVYVYPYAMMLKEGRHT